MAERRPHVRRTCRCGSPAVLSGQCGPCWRGEGTTCPGCRERHPLLRHGICAVCSYRLRQACERHRRGTPLGALTPEQRAAVLAVDPERLARVWPKFSALVVALRRQA